MGEGWMLPDVLPFLTTLAMMPVMAAAGVWVVFKAVQGEIGIPAALAAFLTLVGLYAASVWSGSSVVSATVVVGLVVGMAFFPFASAQLERWEMREIDIDRIDQAHKAVSARPDNWSAWFALAKALKDFGLVGHAVAISETTLKKLPTHRDPLTERSVRDLFSAEERELAKWKRGWNPESRAGVKCPLCGHSNPYGALSCEGCGGAYLLELARRARVRPVVYGKLAVGYAVVAGAVTASAWAGVALEWPASVGAVLAVLTLAGLVLAALFRAKLVD
jgi:hypothetical protein